ncbi:MAG: hypothetical protein NTY22_04720, partial [Proteobacteria bacterium]|nr:hypothetical protein [Pseudomonadota bacterium]
DQRVSCSVPISGHTYGQPSFLYPPMITMDSSNDMFMAFEYQISDYPIVAGICINSTYRALPIYGDDFVNTVNAIAEADGNIHVVGSIYNYRYYCTGGENSESFPFECAAIWKSDTDYTAEFLMVPELPYVYATRALSVSVDNGHIYVLGNGSEYHDGEYYVDYVGYWLDGVFHDQTALLTSISKMSSFSVSQIEVHNGVVYESGQYVTSETGGYYSHVFYIKDGVLTVLDDIVGRSADFYVVGMRVVNGVVYMAVNDYDGITWRPTPKLIVGNTVTTLTPKDDTYFAQAYSLGVNNSGVAYVVGAITPKLGGLDQGAIWSTIAEPKFYDNVSDFTGVILK